MVKPNCIARSFRLSRPASANIDILAKEWQCSKTRAVEMSLEIAVNSLTEDVPTDAVELRAEIIKPSLDSLRDLIAGIQSKPLVPDVAQTPMTYTQLREIEQEKYRTKAAAKDKTARALDRGDIEYD